MKNVISILLAITTINAHVLAQSDIMLSEIRNNKFVNLAEFVKHFPYDKYLNQIDFTDFETLQNDRLLLYKEKGDGDIFLYYLGQKFIEYYPVQYNDLEKKMEIGEYFLNPSKGNWNENTDEIYKIIGLYILGKVSRIIEAGIKDDKLEADSDRIKNLIDRLESNKIYIAHEKSTTEKFFEKLFNLEFEYIFDRAYLTLTNKLSNENNKEANDSKSYKTKIKQKRSNSYIRIANRSDNAVNIFSLEEEGRKLGHSIWIERPYVKAEYFAYQNVYEKFANIKKKESLILATSGGYTNSKLQPEGLTVEDGIIVNATIMHDRHGLVIIEKNGGIRILNLKNDSFLLPYGGPKINNPLKDLIAFSKLLSWAKGKRATLFQTHLLAFSDKVLISPVFAKSQIRERRILALCSDNKTKKVHHIIFDVTSPFSLAKISLDIFSLLKKRNKKVEGLLNLDVGSYNILQVYDTKENVILFGPISINSATNLIVYTLN